MEMDKDILSWVLEFLLRQERVPDALINKILTNPQVLFDIQNIRLKKIILLRSIDSEIKDGSVSEAILNSIEIIEELDRKKKIKVSGSMKVAYCAVALECTVKYLWGNRSKADNVKFSQAVKRIWGDRFCRLEMMKDCELVTDELRKCRKDIEVVLSDSDVYERLKLYNTHNDALFFTAAFISEAMAIMGPPFLQRVARSQREAKEKEAKIELEKKAIEAITGKEAKEMQMMETADGREPPQREAMKAAKEKEKEEKETRDEREPKQKEAVEVSTEKEDAHIMEGSGHTTVEELGAASGQGISGLANSSPMLVVADTSVPNVLELQRKMVLRKYELNHRHFKGLAKNTDSEDMNLEKTYTQYNTLSTPEVRQTLETLKSSSIELQAAVEDPLPNALHVADTVVAEVSRKNLDSDSLNGEQRGKEANNLNQEALVPKQSREGVGTCLMDRNSTARTYEWDDSINESLEATNKKIHLDSPKSKNLSPLREYEAQKFAKRRKMRKWSLEEEDALRKGVLKYGKGNWKLILSSERDLFNGRTEVDLKDKWRNLMR